MGDILTIEMYNEIDDHLTQINSLHPNLKFTVEVENEKGELPFLDTKLIHKKDGNLESMWYRKKTDTGLAINYHALAPLKYKRNMIITLVHRTFN